MDSLLIELGLSDAEVAVYQFLLAHSADTAAAIAKHVKQTRTNTYMLLNKLVERGVLIADDSQAVRRYGAANPVVLQEQLKVEQRKLARTSKSLELAMPDLLAAFNLTQQRPGVVYLEGLDGLKASFEDQARSKTDLMVWGSDIANRDPKVWQVIEKGGYKRRARGIKTKCLFQSSAAEWPHIKEFALKGFEVRLWGEQALSSEVLIYDNRVTFTTFTPEIMVTIVTNEVLANTFRTIFENCWETASKI
jgi:predicted transcriptional regulator